MATSSPVLPLGGGKLRIEVGVFPNGNLGCYYYKEMVLCRRPAEGPFWKVFCGGERPTVYPSPSKLGEFRGEDLEGPLQTMKAGDAQECFQLSFPNEIFCQMPVNYFGCSKAGEDRAQCPGLFL